MATLDNKQRTKLHDQFGAEKAFLNWWESFLKNEKIYTKRR